MLANNSYIPCKNQQNSENYLRNPLIHEQHNLLLNTCPFLAPVQYCCKLFALGAAVALDYQILLLGNLSVIFFLRLVAESKTKNNHTIITHMYVYNTYIHIFTVISFRIQLSKYKSALRNCISNFKDNSLWMRGNEMLMSRELIALWNMSSHVVLTFIWPVVVYKRF